MPDAEGKSRSILYSLRPARGKVSEIVFLRLAITMLRPPIQLGRLLCGVSESGICVMEVLEADSARETWFAAFSLM